MGNKNILIKNKNFIGIIWVSYFVLCFFDMKSIGLIYAEESMLFRVLNQQVFVMFLVPLQILSVLNEKVIRIQKNYLVVYANDEILIIKQLTNLITAAAVLFYIVGQVFFGVVNYVSTGHVYLEHIWFCLITIMEMVAMGYIIVFCLLMFKKNLFVCTIYYALILLLLIYNNGYITIPMTIKNIYLLNDEFLVICLSRLVWIFVAFTAFRIALIKHKKCFYEE